MTTNKQLKQLLDAATQIRELDKQLREIQSVLEDLRSRQQGLQSAIDEITNDFQPQLNAIDSEISRLEASQAQAAAESERQNRIAIRLEMDSNLPGGTQIDLNALRRALGALKDESAQLNRELAAAEAAGDVQRAEELRIALEENATRQDALQLLLDMAAENGWRKVGTREFKVAAERARELAIAAQQEADRLAAEKKEAEEKHASIVDEMKAALAPLEEDMRRLESQIASQQKELDKTQADLTQIQAAQTAALERLYSQLAFDVPLALLPVRLETRFLSSELLVRIYPDDIHQDSHEPALTDNDVKWRAFFQKEAAAGHKLEAWRQLVGKFGARRAAYIADGPTMAAEESKRSHTTRTELMPDRWRAVGYQLVNGQMQEKFAVWGDLVPQPLQTGIRLQPIPQGSRGEKTFFDEETHWLVDFESAEQVGMGIRVLLTDNLRTNGLDLLLVYGVKGTLDADVSASLLSSALLAHAYTWGLGLPSQGTATNDTESEPTGYSPVDINATENAWLMDGLQLTEDSKDGFRLAKALGIPTSTLARAQGADGTDQRDAAAMNAVLYPATWGYLLKHLQSYWGDEWTSSNYEHFWSYFTRWVRGRGPLPILRVHDQPYGILPVSTLNPSLPGSTITWVYDILLQLIDLWKNLSRTEPRVDSNDPNGSLARILSLQPVSDRYLVRRLVGSEMMESLLQASGQLNSPELFNRWNEYLRTRHDAWHIFPSRAGNSPLLTGFFDERGDLLSLPLVQDGPLTAEELLEPNYIADLLHTLRQGGLDPIHARTTDSSAPLLLRLLRHSLLSLAVEVLQRIDPSDLAPEPELVDFLSGQTPTSTAWRKMYSRNTGGETLMEVVRRSLLSPDEAASLKPDFKKMLLTYVDGLSVLSQLPASRLELLMRESLDLTSHRLDAWITSLVTDRLEQQRKVRPTGLQLGGYGWVENLRPRGGRRMSEGGYIHAPSTTHAAAAGILRSGYLSPPVGIDRSLWSIDLSSARVRSALELLEGVRSGQSLSALLGYRFERILHEAHLDIHINSFRNLAPSSAGKQIPLGSESAEAVAARDVVDGLALLRRWQKERDNDTWNGSTISPDLLPVANAHMPMLEEAVDSVSDLLVAESAYQAARGSSVRAGATLDALSRGETPPAEFEVARSARSGVSVTHRVLLLLDSPQKLPGNWPWKADRPRTLLEPGLDYWVGRLLGNPSQYEALVRFYDSDGNIISDSLDLPQTVNLGELELAAMDVIVLFAPSAVREASDVPLPGRAEESDLGSPLGRLLVAHVMAKAAQVPQVSSIKIDLETAPTGKLPLAALFELIRSARALLANATPLRPDHLASPSGAAPITPAKPDIVKPRAEQAVQSFKASFESLKNCLAAPSSTASDLRAALMGAASFTAEAIPIATLGSDGEISALRAQATVVEQTLARRQSQLEKLSAPASRADDSVITAYYLEQLEILAGSEFPILSVFSALDPAFQTFWSSVPDGATPASIFQWIGRAARLRERVDRLHLTLLYNEAAGEPLLSNFRVVQLPPNGKSEKWVGLDYDLKEEETFPGGRLSLVINAPDGQAQTICGLLIDDWIEIIPSRNEVTGVAFHYDAPQATPPQAILLALHPQPGRAWAPDMLAQVLLDSRELVRMRLLTPGQVTPTDHFPQLVTHLLPALFFAENNELDATISMKIVD